MNDKAPTLHDYLTPLRERCAADPLERLVRVYQAKIDIQTH